MVKEGESGYASSIAMIRDLEVRGKTTWLSSRLSSVLSIPKLFCL